METRLIYGKPIAERIRRALAEDIRRSGLNPGLGVVLAGDDPASHLYVGIKELAAGEIGIRFEKKLFPASAGTHEIIEAVEEFGRRGDIDGILVQLPLPRGIDEEAVLAAVPTAKDADGFRPDSPVPPVTVSAVRELVLASGIESAGRSALVIANSEIFAGPQRRMLEGLGFKSESITDLAVAGRLSRDSELIVIAIGRPGWLTREKINEGAVIIDVGTTRGPAGKVRGDADRDGLMGRAGAISAVPGGVGPLTVAYLLKNVAELAKKRRALR